MIQDWDDTTLEDLVGTLPKHEAIPEDEQLAQWWDQQQDYPAFG